MIGFHNFSLQLHAPYKYLKHSLKMFKYVQNIENVIMNLKVLIQPQQLSIHSPSYFIQASLTPSAALTRHYFKANTRYHTISTQTFYKASIFNQKCVIKLFSLRKNKILCLSNKVTTTSISVFPCEEQGLIFKVRHQNTPIPCSQNIRLKEKTNLLQESKGPDS